MNGSQRLHVEPHSGSGQPTLSQRVGTTAEAFLPDLGFSTEHILLGASCWPASFPLSLLMFQTCTEV